MSTRPTDVIAVREGDDLNWSRLETWLLSNIADLDGPMTVAQFGGGHANLTYCVTFAEREVVVRRPPHGDLAPGAHDMAREHRVLTGLAELFDRAPRSLALCTDAAVIGSTFVVVERREGIVVRDQLPESWADLDGVRNDISLALVDAMADLHSIDPAGTDLATLGRPHGFVDRQLAGWARRWELADGRSDLFERTHRLLVSSQPVTRTHCIIHNDFKLDNCMFSIDRAGRVSTVLDWDMATLGDPLIELGTLLSYWPAEGSGLSRSPTIELDMSGFPNRDDLIARYSERGFEVESVDWYEAFGLWKLAVVLQQLHRRHHDGQTTDARSASFDVNAHDVLMSAAAIATKFAATPRRTPLPLDGRQPAQGEL